MTDKVKCLLDKSIIGGDNKLIMANADVWRMADFSKGYAPDREQLLLPQLIKARAAHWPG